MHALTRRQLLHHGTFGVGSVALAWLLNRQRLLAEPAKPDLERKHFDLKPKPAHFAPRAMAMISLFMQGGPSQVDLFDHKPKLTELDGKPFPGQVKYDNAAQASSTVLGSPWKFAKHGQSGIELSELLPHLDNHPLRRPPDRPDEQAGEHEHDRPPEDHYPPLLNARQFAKVRHRSASTTFPSRRSG